MRFGTRPDERAWMARGLALIFGAGATLVLLTLLFEAAEVRSTWGVAVAPLVAYGVVVVMLTVGGRLPLWVFPSVPAFGGVLVSVCVIYGGEASGAYAFMYVWVGLYAGWFFSPAIVVGLLAWCAALFAGAIALGDGVDAAPAFWLMAVGTAGVAATLVAGLVRVQRAQADDIAAVAELASGLGDPADHADETCGALLLSIGADTVALVEPGGDGEEAVVLGAAGDGASTLAQRLRGGLEHAVTREHPVTLRRADRVVGLAHPVLCDGRPAAALLVGWQRPRRRVPGRAESAASVFAAQAGVGMERLRRLTRESERRALEINDNVVQGLVVAKYALDAGRHEAAAVAVQETLERARELMTDQLEEVARTGGEIQPGDLVREAPGEVGGG